MVFYLTLLQVFYYNQPLSTIPITNHYQLLSEISQQPTIINPVMTIITNQPLSTIITNHYQLLSEILHGVSCCTTNNGHHKAQATTVAASRCHRRRRLREKERGEQCRGIDCGKGWWFNVVFNQAVGTDHLWMLRMVTIYIYMYHCQG